MTEDRTRSRSTSCMKAPRRANGQGAWALQVLPPGHCRCGCKHPDVLAERERYASAKIEDVGSNKAVVIEKMIQGEFAAVVAREHFGGRDEVDSVMREVKGLDELERQTRCHEVSDGAVDASAIRADVNCLLNEGVREPRLKVESRKQVISEPSDRRANDQSAQIATDDSLAQTLVMVAWNNHFHEGREREPRRLQKFESGPEVEVLSRSVIRTVIDVRRLALDADRVRKRPLLVPDRHVGERCVYGDPVAQSVLDVPDERMRLGLVERQVRKDQVTRNTQLPARGDHLVRHADRAFARCWHESLRRGLRST